MEKSLQEQQFEALQTANEYIVKLINGINMYINKIKENKYDEALDLLSYILEGIDWLNEVARLTKDIQKKNMDEELMKEQLEKISEYLNIEDYEKILNIIKDEILPLMKEWQLIIGSSIVA
ncbi:hypothetical protein FDC22_16705 [Clostridium botulinum]|uniref:DUF8042 domain-containing protein n=1 Tax=Clostridium botulinum (strain Okra / Type B1) TaxID=498213 RepID=B1IK56_CLOBK|nr:hypothetical protein [Clostridium botulinum]EKX81219.1 hypothetical protein CFSAN001628_001722 [Clostridium botulinum CFSAN001628]ACA45972.1 conserved hypothetical protein [Clostridium botulinum B1 str. Okra]MBD5562201.1 hypothetical protein [Clostridium botulinum]MBD5567156.1 hypothetical protein [Clostridium botulinum]MBD5570231.1 hypothetical protein [Clostridium botulinum]